MVRAFQHPAIDDVTLDGLLYALSDPTRRDIVAKLMERGCMNCSQTCADLPPSTVSHHHRILRENGLIRSQRRGVEVLNTVRRDEIDQRFPGLLDAILPHTAA